MTIEDVAREAVAFTLEEGEPNSPYARAANRVTRALEGRGDLPQALLNLAETLAADLRPEWSNDPDGKQAAMVEKLTRAAKAQERKAT